MADWKMKLADIFNEKDKSDSKKKAESENFIRQYEKFKKSVLEPTFKELKVELEKRERKVEINFDNYVVTMKVIYDDNEEFIFGVKMRHNHPYPFFSAYEYMNDKRFSAEGTFKSEGENLTIESITKEKIINKFLEYYKSHLII